MQWRWERERDEDASEEATRRNGRGWSGRRYDWDRDERAEGDRSWSSSGGREGGSYGERGSYGGPGGYSDRGSYGGQGGYGGAPGNPYHYGENRERFGGGSPGYGGQGAYEGGQGSYGPGQHNEGGGYRGTYAGYGGGFGSSGGYGGGGGYGDRWGQELGPSGTGGQGRGRHSGKGPKGYQRDWNRVREEVCDVLERDDWVDASNVEVRVENGEVTLSGTVEDREQKRHAERIVERVHGVRDVQNQIRVQSQQGQQSHQGPMQSSQQTRGMSSMSGGDASRENNEEQGRGSAQSGRAERNPRAT